MRGIVVPLTEERDVETLRQISLLLERENQRLLTKNLQLTSELARLGGLPEVAQLTFAVEQTLRQTRTAILDGAAATPSSSPRPARPGHGPRAQPALPIVEIRHELPADQRACPACGGTLTDQVGLRAARGLVRVSGVPAAVPVSDVSSVQRQRRPEESGELARRRPPGPTLRRRMLS
jgi:hypothetical protein